MTVSGLDNFGSNFKASSFFPERNAPKQSFSTQVNFYKNTMIASAMIACTKKQSIGKIFIYTKYTINHRSCLEEASCAQTIPSTKPCGLQTLLRVPAAVTIKALAEPNFKMQRYMYLAFVYLHGTEFLNAKVHVLSPCISLPLATPGLLAGHPNA